MVFMYSFFMMRSVSNLMVEEGFLSPNPRYLTHRVNFCSNRGMGQGWANGIMMTRIFELQPIQYNLLQLQ